MTDKKPSTPRSAIGAMMGYGVVVLLAMLMNIDLNNTFAFAVVLFMAIAVGMKASHDYGKYRAERDQVK